jgi:hypothetical protein
MKKCNYYAFCFWCGSSTTTGEPHKRTGRLSVAGQLKAFEDRQSRDYYTSRFNAVAVNRRSARKYFAGASVESMLLDFDVADIELER